MMDAPKAARHARALHWPLEFPDVMQRGGFDVVLGNPPWEVMQLSEEEYFASRKPEIADLKGAARKRAIAELEATEPEVFASFAADKRAFESGNEFARESGRFDLTAHGKVNTYSLFAELFTSLARQRAGVIVPTGIATDATTAPFFAHLVDKQRLARLVDFENSGPLFPSVHRSFKFALLTLGRDEPIARFAFFLTNPAQLAEPERNFTLSPAEIAAINPNTKTAPVFRSRADAELTAKIYRHAPVLIDEANGAAGNPWGVEFRQGLFNMTSDSGLFRTAAQLASEGFTREGTNWLRDRERFKPLYEAKMIHQFDHRWAGYSDDGEFSSELSSSEKHSPSSEPLSRYWVNEINIEERLNEKKWKYDWQLCWRDICRATDERTVIFSIIPRYGTGNTIPIFLSKSPVAKIAAVFANLNSIFLDYAARQSIGGTHLTYFYLKQLPILHPDFYDQARLNYLIPKILELTFTSGSLAGFARDLGYDGHPFEWNEARREILRAEIDAFYAIAYQLTRDELRYVLDPTEVKGSDYPSETFRVIKEKQIRNLGEYRTKRLVLEAWDTDVQLQRFKI